MDPLMKIPPSLTREEHEVSSKNDEKNSAEVTIPAGQLDADLDGILTTGRITVADGSMWGSMIIDPALSTSGPRYRIHLGHMNVWPLAPETTRNQALAMAKGLRDNGPHNVRLVEITETATEIQLDEETKA